jgi:hypothetical protein
MMADSQAQIRFYAFHAASMRRVTAENGAPQATSGFRGGVFN